MKSLQKVLLMLLVAVILFFTCAGLAEGTGHSGQSEGHSNEADGNKIEMVHLLWLTADTRDNGDPDNL